MKAGARVASYTNTELRSMLDKARFAMIAVVTVAVCLGILLSLGWLFFGLLTIISSDGTRYPCRATVNVTSVQYDGGVSTDCPVLIGVYAVGSDVYHAHDRPCTDPDVVHTFDIMYDPRHPEKYVTLTEVNFRNTGYSDLMWSSWAFWGVLVLVVCARCCSACVDAVDVELERRRHRDVQLASVVPSAARVPPDVAVTVSDPEKDPLLERDRR